MSGTPPYRPDASRRVLHTVVILAIALAGFLPALHVVTHSEEDDHVVLCSDLSAQGSELTSSIPERITPIDHICGLCSLSILFSSDDVAGPLLLAERALPHITRTEPTAPTLASRTGTLPARGPPHRSIQTLG